MRLIMDLISTNYESDSEEEFDCRDARKRIAESDESSQKKPKIDIPLMLPDVQGNFAFLTYFRDNSLLSVFCCSKRGRST